LAAGEDFGSGAYAHEDVGSAGGFDGAAGVLIEHESLKGATAAGVGDGFGIDEDESGAGVDGFVGGEGGFGCDFEAEGTGGPVFAGVFGKEDEVFVFENEVFNLLRVGAIGVTDGGEGDGVGGEHARVHQGLAEAGVGAVGFSGVADVEGFAIGHFKFGGTVDVDDVGIEFVFEPEEFVAGKHI